MRTILTAILENLLADRTIILAAIIRSTGSAPRDSGARMLICEDGSINGTIGGGELEADSIQSATALFGQDDDFALLDFNLTTAQAAMSGMVCGGRQQVLLQKIEPTSQNRDLFQNIRTALESGDKMTLLTILRKGIPVHFKIFEGDDSSLDLTESMQKDLAGKAAKCCCPFNLEEEDTYLFGEPLVQPRTVHFAGGGHVAQATARLAAIVGYRVRVLDDREEFANSELFPDADRIEVVDDFANSLGTIPANDMIVIVTRGHLHDRAILRQALNSKAIYIGMIGSRTKRDATYTSLRKEGFTDSDFARVHCPIGLPIGGDSPAEIGLSIVAQLQQVKYGKN